MALNYCPNCGAKIDSTQKFCPNCGCPLQESNEIEEKKEEAKASIIATPKDTSWVQKWRNRSIESKVLELLLFTALLIPLFIMAIKLIFESLELDAFLSIASFFLLFVVIMGFAAIYHTVLSRKFIVKKIDGYTAVLFMKRSQNALIVEDEIVNSQALYNSRYHHTIPQNLYAVLPNRTRIHANFEDKSRPIDIYVDGRD